MEYVKTGVIFATRQLHTTILWHLKSNGNGDNQPILEKIYEKQDTSSIISCVDVNPITKGEFCELRQNDFLSISRNRYSFVHFQSTTYSIF